MTLDEITYVLEVMGPHLKNEEENTYRQVLL